MKQVNQVLSTNDYGMFKNIDGNRKVNKLHVNRLKDSFKIKYLLSPIIVNSKYEIIDGQHRFEAAKDQGLEINFIMCDDYSLSEVQLLNTNMKNWTKKYYLNAYCDLGYPEYLKFRNFMRKFPEFGITNCETILTEKLGGSNSTSKEMKSDSNKRGYYHKRDFQEGKLVIPNFDNAVDNAEKIMMVKPYYEGYNRRTFVIALLGIFKIKEYDHSQLIHKLKNNPSSLQHCVNVSNYKLMIEDIYNFRSRDKVSLRF